MFANQGTELRVLMTKIMAPAQVVSMNATINLLP